MIDQTDKPLLHDLKRFYHYVRPYRLRAVAGVLLTMITGLFDPAIAWLLAPYMDNVVLQAKAPSVDMSWLPVYYYPIAIVVLALVQSLVSFGANYLTAWVGKRTGNDLKLALFDNLTHSDSSHFDKTTTGEVLLRYNGDADTATDGLLNNVKNFTSRLVTSVALIAVMFTKSWILTLVTVGVLLFTVLPLNRIRKRMKRFIKDTVQSGAVVTTNFNETCAGNRVITSYGLQDYARERLKTTLNTLFRLGIKMVQRTNFLSLIMHFATAVGMAATVWVQGYLIQIGHMSPGDLVSFLAALLMFYQPIKKLGSNFSSIQVATMAIQRVLSILDLKPTIVSKPGAKPMRGMTDAIRYQDVSFSYETGKPVLKHVDLEIRAGRSVAFVGNSGGGKTTMVNLLPRFYDVCGGAVTIDGTDIRDLDLDDLRANIAIVFQDNFLFGGSIRENIMLGKRDATDEQVAAAVKGACLEDFVTGLEHGLDTQIGERGVMLSGGQKQRVAIARAFIKDAPIVILDEATSALDNQSEKVVQQAIENLMLNKTVLIIAHRLSTVINADTIVVLRDGEIVESGRHAELLAKNGVYASLYQTQLA